MKFTSTLKKNYEFHRLYRKGRSAATRFLVVYARAGKRPENRIGITVKSVFGKSVCNGDPEYLRSCIKLYLLDP